jgi:hypothetical protein
MHKMHRGLAQGRYKLLQRTEIENVSSTGMEADRRPVLEVVREVTLASLLAEMILRTAQL